jgi:hypothetical protein
MPIKTKSGKIMEHNPFKQCQSSVQWLRLLIGLIAVFTLFQWIAACALIALSGSNFQTPSHFFYKTRF